MNDSLMLGGRKFLRLYFGVILKCYVGYDKDWFEACSFLSRPGEYD